MTAPDRRDGLPLQADASRPAVRARYVRRRETGVEHPAAALRSVLVEYGDRPDRRTVFPHELGRDELLVTWLTADNDAFVDLLACR